MELIKKITNLNPENRPSCEELLKNKIFEDIKNKEIKMPEITN